MTCVAAYKDNKGILFACDSAITPTDYNLGILGKKVIQLNGITLGWAGVVTNAQVVVRNIDNILTTFPKRQSADSIAMEIAYRVKHYLSLEDSIESQHIAESGVKIKDAGVQLIYAIKNSVYVMGPDMSVLKCRNSISAIGSGTSPFISSFISLPDKLDPKTKLLSAMKNAAASLADKSVGPPYYIIKHEH